MTRLGPHQIRRLRVLAGAVAQVVSDRVARSLVSRGLCADEGNGRFVHITPAGLRALADAAEAGKVSLAPERLERRP